MTDEVFKWVIAVAVLVVFLSNLVLLWLIYSKVKPLMAKLQTTSDKINPILGEAQGIMSHAKDVVAEAQPIVRSIMAKTNDRIDPILGEVQGIMGNTKGITGTISNVIADNRPAVQSIMTKTNERVDPVLNEVQGIMANVKGITGKVESIAADALTVAHNVTTRANSITDMVYGQATEIRTLIQDTVIPTLRQQAERLDDLVKRTTDKADSATATIETEIRTFIQDTMAPTFRRQAEHLEDLVKRTSDKADSATATIENEIIGRAVTTTKDITEMIHNQANELNIIINDTVLKVRTLVEQLDDILKRTRDVFDSSFTNLERQVTTPVREVNYVGTAIRKGLSVLFNKDKGQAG